MATLDRPQCGSESAGERGQRVQCLIWKPINRPTDIEACFGGALPSFFFFFAYKDPFISLA